MIYIKNMEIFGTMFHSFINIINKKEIRKITEKTIMSILAIA